MNSTTRCATVSSLFFVTACVVSMLGLTVAGKTFAPGELPAQDQSAVRTAALPKSEPALEPALGTSPTSHLVGASAPQTAKASAAPEARPRVAWVEAVDSVNMRKGPSSRNPVIKVQRAGAKLRVASHDGQWVKVVEPKTGEQGWVYGEYVRRLERVSARGDPPDLKID